jgi:hypothetical protein
MFPQFYLLYLQRQLKNTEYLTLKTLVYLWQSQKQVSIELLATLMPNPFQFESRRRRVQRFLKLSTLNIESLWFPLVPEILKAKFPQTQKLTAYSRFINYTPETGSLYSSRIITDSVQETKFLALYLYMEYAVN